MARFALWSSSEAFAPFIAAKIPPHFKKGRQYSLSTFILATALAHDISYFSLYSGFLPASSALMCTTSAFKESSSITLCTNFNRLPVESIRVMFMSGLAIKITTPGKPAPVPTSIIFAPFFISTSFKRDRQSAKCFETISLGSVMAVRFMVLFVSTSISAYLSKRSRAVPSSSMPRAAACALRVVLSIILNPLFQDI